MTQEQKNEFFDCVIRVLKNRDNERHGVNFSARGGNYILFTEYMLSVYPEGRVSVSSLDLELNDEQKKEISIICEDIFKRKDDDVFLKFVNKVKNKKQ